MGAKRSLPWVRAAVILSLALAAPVDPASAAGRGEPGPVFEARVPLRDPAADLRTLRELDIDVDAVFGGVTKWARVFLVEEEIGKLADLGFALQSSTPEAGPSEGYHTYETLTSELQQVAADHPALVRLTSLGTSVQGRELWMVKITRNPDVEEDEPEVRYIAAMHGDEPVGKEMVVRLIHRLTDDYGTDPRITALVDSNEIWILPSMNPDGTAAQSRYNANGVDLNRDFPDQFSDPVDSTDGRDPETRHVMNWVYAHATNLSANFHGGALVSRYPFDADATGASIYSAAPEDSVFVSLARTYTDANPSMVTSNGDTSFDNGIANGAAWLPLNGGMQDWNAVWRGGRELTLEISQQKWPAASKLDGFWNENQESMLAFLERGREGVRGIVRDAATGAPLRATVRVVGTSGNGSETSTDPDVGDYHRLLLPGRYDLEFSATGYAGALVRDVVVSGGPAVRRDLELEPLGPALVVAAVQVQDGPGGDGVLSPGESAELVLTVRNLGSPATGISARLVPTGWFATVASDAAPLPDLPAGGTAASLPPNPVGVAAADAPAGHKLGFALAWSSAEGSGVSDPFFLPVGPAACDTVASTDVPKPIPDRETVDSALVVTADREIAEVDVRVDIQHTYIGDLHVHALSPAGTPVALHLRSGGSTDDIVGWYDSERTPAEPLTRFDGESASGAWTLRIRDGVRSNTGSLRGWSLRACGRPFEASIPELRFREIARTAGGGAVLTWWPYPRLASYRVRRSTGPPTPGSFVDITGADDDPTDTRFEDDATSPITYWQVSGVGGASSPPLP